MIYINPYLSVPINTIIGGVAGSISSRSALATKLAISESIIKRFEIVGSDVHCRITEDYQPKNAMFQNDTSIVSFEDFEGKMKYNIIGGAPQSIFRGSTIEYAYLPGITTLWGYAFTGSNLKHLKADILTKANLSSLQTGNLETVDAPLLTDLSESNVMLNTSNVSSVNFTPTNIGYQSLRGSSATPSLENVHALGNFALYANVTYTELNLLSLTSVGQTSITSCSQATIVRAPLLESIANSANFFNGLSSCDEIDMKMLKTYGTLAAGGGTGATYGFLTLKLNCLIKVNEALATANSGSPHAAFVWVKANRGATVEFYDDSGNYVSTL